jgi:CheY-like chemotaxis protein
MNGKKILVVEDNPLNPELVSELLEASGFVNASVLIRVTNVNGSPIDNDR